MLIDAGQSILHDLFIIDAPGIPVEIFVPDETEEEEEEKRTGLLMLMFCLHVSLPISWIC